MIRHVNVIIVFLLFLLSISLNLFAYRQIEIPLSNKNGVPWMNALPCNDNSFMTVDGFEIDSEGNMFFFGGDEHAILAKYSKDNKQVFRKYYKGIRSNKLSIINNDLYSFNNRFVANGTTPSNSFLILSPINGEIIKQVPEVITNDVNSFEFCDSFVIAEIFNNNESINLSSKTFYGKFDLRGKLLKKVDNEYDLPINLFPFSLEARGKANEDMKYANMYLGKWNDLFVFSGTPDYFHTHTIYYLCLKNEKGEIVSKTKVDAKGTEFYLGQEEHRKLRNSKIYILTRNKMNAIITIIPVGELFSSSLPGKN